MNLFRLLQARAAAGRPVRVGLVGAGKFGSMFLSQVPTTPGLAVAAIADLSPDRARQACRGVGWTEERIAATRFTDDAAAMIAAPDVEVVVEATGHAPAGIRHARAAIREGKHIVMVNVEADVLAGPLLARDAEAAGIVYSLAYGDQPALICEMVDWARACGFPVIAAGKGTKYRPEYHASTPETVWGHYGLTPEEARVGGMNPQMFNSFLDGTKSGIEMAAVANASGLTPAPDGLVFPPVGTHELADALRPGNAGTLHHAGQVEVVSSVHRDGSPVANDLRWGVFVVFEAPNDYAARCFREYGVATDQTGRVSALYRPFHLIGLELNVSILSAALRGEATGAPTGFRGDVVSTAKRDLRAGEVLDGEGGACVWGKLMTATDSLRVGGLPIGLANRVPLMRDVKAGQPVTWADVRVDQADEAYRYRRAMEAAFPA
ncbi:MAG TPA: Gfo/Idh/MocA family oxidoreductase [Rhodopila sp.]|uniref:NAD(P)H-dependent oxidoreductase n=1 Tax=Rhodopila sp. TaxID=2480087 RepID=UPI002CCE3AAC|nr:Gfo/Idh/MocA family oxidoreductase [Rhodopila sp.]HVY16858.1 Gfo/Idh/MocA family oxidoreductase [Rhodopila sp.]